jgi:hypothetical protein
MPELRGILIHDGARIPVELRRTADGLCWYLLDPHAPEHERWDRHFFESAEAAEDYLHNEARLNGVEVMSHA